ncbi:MAG: hypothetical protein KDA37_16125, partial [Planctomycetales bacterium]|nr:hypothetical protein [Planctomycetales bacterium]
MIYESTPVEVGPTPAQTFEPEGGWSSVPEAPAMPSAEMSDEDLPAAPLAPDDGVEPAAAVEPQPLEPLGDESSLNDEPAA